MKKSVKLDVYVSTETDKPLITCTPNFTFIYNFDDDDNISEREYFEKRYYVESIVNDFRKIGCQAFYEITERYRPDLS